MLSISISLISNILHINITIFIISCFRVAVSNNGVGAVANKGGCGECAVWQPLACSGFGQGSANTDWQWYNVGGEFFGDRWLVRQQICFRLTMAAMIM